MLLGIQKLIFYFAFSDQVVKNETVAEMNSHSFMLAERLIPATYLQQAAAAKKSRENLIRQLIEQVNYLTRLSLYESQ